MSSNQDKVTFNKENFKQNIKPTMKWFGKAVLYFFSITIILWLLISLMGAC